MGSLSESTMRGNILIVVLINIMLSLMSASWSLVKPTWMLRQFFKGGKLLTVMVMFILDSQTRQSGKNHILGLLSILSRLSPHLLCPRHSANKRIKNRGELVPRGTFTSLASSSLVSEEHFAENQFWGDLRAFFWASSTLISTGLC